VEYDCEDGRIVEFFWTQDLPGLQSYEKFQQELQRCGSPDFYARGDYAIAASWVRDDTARVMYVMSLAGNQMQWSVACGPASGLSGFGRAQPEKLDEFVAKVDEAYREAGVRGGS
jgi:hypothetical protein